jgi:predicted PurR-regulated permease PerM
MSIPTPHTPYKPFVFWLKAGLILAALWLMAYIFSNILFYFLVSVIISAILTPIVNYINNIQVFKTKIPRIVAVLVAVAFLVLVVYLFVTLFVPLVSDQVRLIRSIEIDELAERVTLPLASLEQFLIQRFNVERETGFIIKDLSNVLVEFVEKLQFGEVLSDIFSLVGSLSVATLAISFFTFFQLYERGLVRKRLIALIPNQYFEVMITILYKIERLLSNYLLGILLETFSIFSILALGLSLFNIKYALTIAALASLINFIPYIGPLSGFIFGLLVGISSITLDSASTGEYTLLKITLIFLIARLADDLFLQPVIFSKSVKAHPVEIFLAIFAGATLAGPLGMIVAVPSYTIVKVVTREFRRGYRQYRVFRN